ncbi:glycoside hydrolase superfamily [Gaertneriomyces semiglobifer]|nr:glycoside hydrolase superfamily [Gaertneriomyces semiglobifer]
MATVVRYWIACLLALALASQGAAQGSVFKNFITRKGPHLYDGDQRFRYVSFNIPELIHLESRPSSIPNSRFAPTQEESLDALAAIHLMGGKVARTYTISVCCAKSTDQPDWFHIKAPGVFNEVLFRSMDRVLALANQLGVRLIVPLINQWSFHGGFAEFAKLYNKQPEAFFQDAQVIAAWKDFLTKLFNRRNTVTGTLYKNDKAIMAWQLGNEMGGWDNLTDVTWQLDIAKFIKESAPQQLVSINMLGGLYPLIKTSAYYKPGQRKLDAMAEHGVLTTPYIDIYGSNFYNTSKQHDAGSAVEHELQLINGKYNAQKAYAIDEFGFMATYMMESTMQVALSQNVSGVLIWSLRHHARDGGWHVHREGYNQNYPGQSYWSYHYPGFPSTPAKESEGFPPDEQDVMRFAKAWAHLIDGKEPPRQGRMPYSPPILFDPATRLQKGARNVPLSWMGSAGADFYSVARIANGVAAQIGFQVLDNVRSIAGGYPTIITDANAPCGVDVSRFDARLLPSDVVLMVDCPQMYYVVGACTAEGRCTDNSNVVGPLRLDCVAEVASLRGRPARLAGGQERNQQKAVAITCDNELKRCNWML